MINFLKFKWLYFLISAFFIIPGIFSMIKWGFKPSIDFIGGTLLEIRLEKSLNNPDELKKYFEDQKTSIGSIQTSGQNPGLSCWSAPSTRRS